MDNLQQSRYNISQHTLTVLLHYLVFKNQYNQNKYVTKIYILKQFSINLHTEITLCLVFDTQPAFVNKNKRCDCE